MESPPKLLPGPKSPSRTLTGTDPQVIERFLTGWPPFASLPATSRRRAAVLRFVAAQGDAERKAMLEATNPLAQLHNVYQSLGILRPDRLDPGALLLAIPLSQVAAAIRDGKAASEWLALLQRSFEFGRHPAPLADQAARIFLQETWAMPANGASRKFCVFGGGVPFSAGGLPHEEITRVYIQSGYGSGPPICAGFIFRVGHTEFVFDYGSTTYRSGLPPEETRKVIQRWIRATGADDKRVALTYKPAAAEKR